MNSKYNPNSLIPTKCYEYNCPFHKGEILACCNVYLHYIYEKYLKHLSSSTLAVFENLWEDFLKINGLIDQEELNKPLPIKYLLYVQSYTAIKINKKVFRDINKLIKQKEITV